MVIYRSQYFDEEVDGLVYASAIATGFSAVENILYVPGQQWNVTAGRSLSAPLSHSLFSAIWGFGLARARVRARPGRIWLWQAGSFAAAAAAHGFYDFVLFTWNAPWLSGALVLALWMGVLLYVRILGAPGAPACGSPRLSPDRGQGLPLQPKEI
jgi:RsiW-degrading membrane proteinase PrsW (M82 family)